MSDAEYGSGREDYGGYSPAKRSSSSRSKSPPRSRSRSLSSHSRSPSPLPRRKHRSRRSSSRSLSRSRSRSYSPPKKRYYRSYSRSRSRSRSRGRGRSRSYSPPPRRYHGGRSGGHRRDHSRSPLSNRRRHTGDRYNPDQSKVLGVFGLSLYTGERDLREMFGKYGPIKEVQVVYDHQTGRSRGFAFVYFEDIDDSVDAKEHCNGLEIDGRRIRVDYSITKRAHTPTPGVYMGKPTRPGGDREDSRERERDRDRDRYYDDDDYYEKPRYSSGGRRSYYY